MKRDIKDKDLEKVTGGREWCCPDGSPLVTPPPGERVTPDKKDLPGDDDNFNRQD